MKVLLVRAVTHGTFFTERTARLHRDSGDLSRRWLITTFVFNKANIIISNIQRNSLQHYNINLHT